MRNSVSGAQIEATSLLLTSSLPLSLSLSLSLSLNNTHTHYDVMGWVLRFSK